MEKYGISSKTKNAYEAMNKISECRQKMVRSAKQMGINSRIGPYNEMQNMVSKKEI